MHSANSFTKKVHMFQGLVGNILNYISIMNLDLSPRFTIKNLQLFLEQQKLLICRTESRKLKRVDSDGKRKHGFQFGGVSPEMWWKQTRSVDAGYSFNNHSSFLFPNRKFQINSVLSVPRDKHTLGEERLKEYGDRITLQNLLVLYKLLFVEMFVTGHIYTNAHFKLGNSKLGSTQQQKI